MAIKNCWIITEGMAGTENQCIAVAEQLNIHYEIKHIGLKFPYDYLSPHIVKTAPKFAITGIDWDAPKPDLIIASGRKAVPVILNFPDAYTVFIQNPHIQSSHFDLVAAPLHDGVNGDNVIHTTAAPNRITEKSLALAKSKFDFSSLPDKKIALLIGGNSKTHKIPDAFAHGLFETLLPYFQSQEYGFLVTVSRRTPDHIRTQLKEIFSFDNCVFWDSEGENPYHAFLANADFILVTEDSTSMLSDALSTGKTTYKIPLIGGSEKFTRLYQNLKRRTGLRDFNGELDYRDYKPLHDAKKIADEIKKHFDK